MNAPSFSEATDIDYEAFRTAMSYRFVTWLNQHQDVFITYKASLGFVWA